MTLSNNNHVTALFAAIVCAFITIGTSVAPAINTVSPYLA